MIVLFLAVVLSQTDAGFVPVVLDVHHGEVFLTARDGGSDSVPTLVPSGVFMDNATTQWVAENKARARAEAAVGPGIDTKTLLAVAFGFGGLGFVLGIVGGFWAASEFFKLLK